MLATFGVLGTLLDFLRLGFVRGLATQSFGVRGQRPKVRPRRFARPRIRLVLPPPRVPRFSRPAEIVPRDATPATPTSLATLQARPVSLPAFRTSTSSQPEGRSTMKMRKALLVAL